MSDFNENILDTSETALKIDTLDVPPVKRKKKAFNKEEVAGTLLASIPLVGFCIFGLVPLVLAFLMAFLKMKDFSIIGAEFVGFDNFKTVLDDPLFWKSIGNTFILGISVFISLFFALIIAYLLSKPIAGKKVFRMIYFIPYVCSVVAVTLMWKYMFNPAYGVINQILGRTAPGNQINWLGDKTYYRWAVIIMSVWSGMGYGIILFTAALTSVNNSMVEAAKIDGAGPVTIFWRVVFPAISPTTFYLVVMGVIGALQSFAVTNVLSSGGYGPDNAGLTVVYYLYSRVFAYVGKMGEASVSAWLLSLIILALTGIQFWGSKKWVSYDQ